MKKTLKYIFAGVMAFLMVLLLNNNFSYALTKHFAYNSCTHEYHPGHWSGEGEDKHWVSGYWSGSFKKQSNTLYWWFTYSDLVESASGNGDGKQYFCMYGGRAMRNSGTGWDAVRCGHSNFSTRFWYTNVHYPALDSSSPSYTFKSVAACAMYNAMHDDDNKGATITYKETENGLENDEVYTPTTGTSNTSGHEPVYKKKKKEVIKYKSVAITEKVTVDGVEQDNTYYVYVNTDENGNFLYEYEKDENGNHKTDENGNKISIYSYAKDANGDYYYASKADDILIDYVTDENGNFVYETDANGNPIYETDENGNKIPETEVDENGNPITDEDGNPVYVYPNGSDNYDTDLEDGFSSEIENTKAKADKYGKKGIQAAIWYSGHKGELGTSDIGSTSFTEARAKLCGFDGVSQFEAWYNFYRIEAATKTTGNTGAERDLEIIDIYGTGNNDSENKVSPSCKASPAYGLLPGEYFYVYLNFPIIYGSVPTGSKNGTVTTYEGQFGKMEITNGTLYQVPQSKTISTDGQYPYIIQINTGVLSSNKVEVKVTKGYYNYETTFNYVKQESDSSIVAQPVGEIKEGPKKEGNGSSPHWATDSITKTFNINSYVSINNYIESIDTFSKVNQSECYNTTGKDGGKGGRKSWSISNKQTTKAVGELGDMITYKIIISNYTKAIVYVDVKDVIPMEVIEIKADNSANVGNITTWKRLKLNQSSNGTTPATLTLTVRGKISTRNYDGAVSIATITGVHATKGSGDTENLMKNIAKNPYNRLEEDSDWFITRKYNISIDQYISKVEHQQDRKGTTTTYSDSSERARWYSNDERKNDPTFVEYGDIVTYTLVLYNTCYNGENTSDPYYAPDVVYVDFDFHLPYLYDNATVEVIGTTSYNHNKNKNPDYLNFSSIPVNRNSTTTITISFVVEEVTKNNTETTRMNITEVYNRNWVSMHETDDAHSIENLSDRISINETYKLSHYNATLEEYIYAYNGEMAIYNDDNGFTNTNSLTTKETEQIFTGNDSVDKANSINLYPNGNPLEVEKYETLQYTTIIRNQYTEKDVENTTRRYQEYNTRIRPTVVTQTIDYGLTQYGYQIYWVHAARDGAPEYKELVGKDDDQTRVKQTLNDDTISSKWVYTYEIIDEEIILSPGDYLYYVTDIEVTESNLCLNNLEYKSDITTLTNINRKNVNDRKTTYDKDIREVTEQNIAREAQNDQGNNRTTYSQFIRLKDLIISGAVWVDENRNGYQDNGENGKNGVVVRLYGNTDSNKPKEYKLIKETTTYRNGQCSADGYYNFGRVAKSWKDENGNYANRLINYFVEFEYYGQMWKATEVYGGMNNGETRGVGNLSDGDNATNDTISYWRQGYNGLPESQSEKIIHKNALGIAGRTEYMTDSNAYEFDNTRSQFNEANKTVGFNQAYNSGIALEYTKNDHASTLNEENDQINTRMTARSFINQSYQNAVNGDDWKNPHGAENTHTLALFGYSYSNSYNYPRYANFNGTESTDKWKTERTNVVETEYLKYINLGLVKREEVDLSLEADVHTVKTTINGEEMTYDYSENTADSTKATYNKEPNAYYLDEAYDLDLYTTDYYYRTSGDDEYYKEGTNKGEVVQQYNKDDAIRDYKTTETENEVDINSSELNTEVTYRVRITNNDIQRDEPEVNQSAMGNDKDHDIPVETAINELTIYYDKNFIKADNTDEITLKKKNGETGLLEDSTRRTTRVYYGTKEQLEKGEGTELKYITKELDTRKTGLTINDNATYHNHYGNNDEAFSNLEEDKNYQVMYLTGFNDSSSNDGLLYLKEGESVYVEITFTVDKDEARNLKITEDNDMGLEMIAEISAYTTKYANDYFHKGLAGKYAALVDRDSNPGNLGKGNTILHSNGTIEQTVTSCEDYDKYEDDTYKVGIKVGLLDGQSPTKVPDSNRNDSKDSDERRITGMVFEDARSKSVESDNSSGIQYLGNGIYNKYINPENGDGNHENALTNPKVANGDKPVEGVKVSLVEVVQIKDTDGKNKYYEYPARYTYDVDVTNANGTITHHAKGELIETRTNSEGKYVLDHFIPGYYKVKFDYGYSYEEKDVNGNPILDEEGNPKITYYTTYNGQDYKSTTYYNEYDGKLLYYNKDNSYGENDNIGSSDKFSYFDKVKNTLLQEKRSDAQDDEIRRLNVNSYSETMTALQAKVFNELVRFKESLTKNTHMYAETAIFYVKPEDLKSEASHIVPKEYREDGKNFNTNITRLWQIHNLDFGLEYRPEASIMLDKEISTLELVTSDNKTLIKLYFEGEIGSRKINETKSIGYENVQFLPNKEKENQGFVYINMDTDILEGCTIKVEYEMTATNESEVDRINVNLDDMKYEIQAAKKKYKGVYTTQNAKDNQADNITYTYNANATAAQFMASQYYADYDYDISTGTELFAYLTKLKKPYIALGEKKVNDSLTLQGQEYYGMYLGETYYTGKIGVNDRVAMLKVDNILDYVDNDFTFSSSENNKPNRLWQAVTSAELIDGKVLDKENVNLEEDEEGNKTNNLIDGKGIRYTTDKKTNLALSVDSNKTGNNLSTGNKELSDFKDPVKSVNNKEKTSGTISVVATKVISADDVSIGKGLSYENIAEVVQYTTITGRRTTLPKVKAENIEGGGVIGNANVAKNWTGVNQYENDTDAAEIITISPPTGLIK